MSDWLLKNDVQEAIKAYLKSSKTLKMLDIYNSMYNKAVNKGDVNSAKWCEEFLNLISLGEVRMKLIII